MLPASFVYRRPPTEKVDYCVPTLAILHCDCHLLPELGTSLNSNHGADIDDTDNGLLDDHAAEDARSIGRAFIKGKLGRKDVQNALDLETKHSIILLHNDDQH